VEQSAKDWNAQSGKFNYVVGKGKDAETYSVNFEITVNEIGNGVAENSVQVLPDNHKLFQPREETIVDANGNESKVTVKPEGVSDGKNFAMKNSEQYNSKKTSHEIGHNLGMSHSSGLMGKEGGTTLGQKSVQQVLGKSGIGKSVSTTGGASMQCSTTIGTSPGNFNSGKVKRNKSSNAKKFE
jgi:hypothetical protein